MRSYLVAIVSTLMMFGHLQSVAQELSQEQILKSADKKVLDANPLMPLPINASILSILTLSEHDKHSAQQQVGAFLDSKITLNVAEQYLIFLVQANIANTHNNEDSVIELVEQAISLEAQIDKKQLNSPPFANGYRLLSAMFEKQQKFKKAFEHKKRYIRRHFRYLKQQKAQRVKRLNQKYRIEKQTEENELLEQKSKLKQYALERASEEEHEQYRNIVFTLCTGLLFVFLLVREFKARHVLKMRSQKDQLTQLANRGVFFNKGHKYTIAAIANHKKLCALLIDIDNLKIISEKCGQDVAHSIIKQVAKLASETMRSRDILARIGREEFAAILPETSIEEARAMAERIREKVYHNVAKKVDCDLHVTASFGIASIEDVNDNFDSLVDAAGVAMHHAKTHGRNQVCNYPIKDVNQAK